MAVRGGFLHLAEALAFHRDADLIGSTVCTIISTLKSGEKHNVEPELISKGQFVFLDWGGGTKGGTPPGVIFNGSPFRPVEISM